MPTAAVYSARGFSWQVVWSVLYFSALYSLGCTVYCLISSTGHVNVVVIVDFV